MESVDKKISPNCNTSDGLTGTKRLLERDLPSAKKRKANETWSTSESPSKADGSTTNRNRTFANDRLNKLRKQISSDIVPITSTIDPRILLPDKISTPNKHSERKYISPDRGKYQTKRDYVTSDKVKSPGNKNSWSPTSPNKFEGMKYTPSSSKFEELNNFTSRSREEKYVYANKNKNRYSEIEHRSILNSHNVEGIEQLKVNSVIGVPYITSTDNPIMNRNYKWLEKYSNKEPQNRMGTPTQKKYYNMNTRSTTSTKKSQSPPISPEKQEQIQHSVNKYKNSPFLNRSGRRVESQNGLLNISVSLISSKDDIFERTALDVLQPKKEHEYSLYYKPDLSPSDSTESRPLTAKEYSHNRHINSQLYSPGGYLEDENYLEKVISSSSKKCEDQFPVEVSTPINYSLEKESSRNCYKVPSSVQEKLIKAKDHYLNYLQEENRFEEVISSSSKKCEDQFPIEVTEVSTPINYAFEKESSRNRCKAPSSAEERLRKGKGHNVNHLQEENCLEKVMLSPSKKCANQFPTEVTEVSTPINYSFEKEFSKNHCKAPSSVQERLKKGRSQYMKESDKNTRSFPLRKSSQNYNFNDSNNSLLTSPLPSPNTSTNVNHTSENVKKTSSLLPNKNVDKSAKYSTYWINYGQIIDCISKKFFGTPQDDKEASKILNDSATNTNGRSTLTEDEDTMDWEEVDDLMCNTQKSEQTIPHETIKKDLYIVVDTNIFLSDLNVLKEIVSSGSSGGTKPVLYVPWMVLSELDYMKDDIKTSSKLKIQVQEAIKFINKSLLEGKRKLIGQNVFEADKQQYVGKCPDDKIISCCLQAKEKYNNVILLSNDINLKNKMLVNEIPAISTSEMLEDFRNVNPEGTSRTDENAVQRKLHKVLEEMSTCCSYIICESARDAYGHLWNKMAMLQNSPPWSLKECIKIFKKYWYSAFEQQFLKQCFKAVEHLDASFRELELSSSADKFEQFVEDCIALCIFFKDVEQHKDFVEDTIKCINSITKC